MFRRRLGLLLGVLAPVALTACPLTDLDPRQPALLDPVTVLATIPVANENGAGYKRSLFGYPTDADGNGCDTRAEVLIRDSVVPLAPSPGNCVLVGGQWVSAYGGFTITNPRDLEIDHVVALKEAWESGASAWDAAKLEAFGNDLSDRRTLVATAVDAIQTKGDKDPPNWMPPRVADECTYIGDWIAIKARWGLSMDQSEYGFIKNLLEGDCRGWGIPAFAPVPVSL